jgi:hypothetical protein
MNKQLIKPILFLLASSALVAACADAYRYPCQDPSKANNTECSCDQQPRTKNKALGALESQATTTTVRLLVGLDC